MTGWLKDLDGERDERRDMERWFLSVLKGGSPTRRESCLAVTATPGTWTHGA
jgi:hypothetical protein